jgi:molybdopterin/thiamine biosynthesis adenylyltransferase
MSDHAMLPGAVVIGLGAVGRQLAAQLALLPITKLTLVDGKTVADKTVLADGYFTEDLDAARVHATAQYCHQLSPQLDV